MFDQEKNFVRHGIPVLVTKELIYIHIW